jgi:hypothetical protein
MSVAYTKGLLERICQRDKCMILNAPATLSCNADIEFLCGTEDCGSNAIRKFRGLYSKGGFCMKCLLARARERAKEHWPDKAWLTGRVPQGYWLEKKNIVSYIDWLGSEMKFSCMEDWYAVDQDTFRKNKGNGILDRFNNSFHKILSCAFPEYEFLPWKFSSVPQGFWTNDDNIKWYLEWLFKELGYNTLDDWCKVTSHDIANNYGRGLLWTQKWKGSVSLLIKSYYEIENFDTKRKTLQYSQVAISWLRHLERKHNINIQHAQNGGEVSLREIGRVDGFCETNNTVYEFHGRFFHGDPRIYNPQMVNVLTNRTYGDHLQKTRVRYQTIIEMGYKYVHVWEDDWINGLDESDVSLLFQGISSYKAYAYQRAKDTVAYFQANGFLPSKDDVLSTWLSAYKAMKRRNSGLASIEEIDSVLDNVPLWRTRRGLMNSTLNAVKWFKEHRRLPMVESNDNEERLHAVFLYNQHKTGKCLHVKAYLDDNIPDWMNVRGIARLNKLALEKAKEVVKWSLTYNRYPVNNPQNALTERKLAAWLVEQRYGVLKHELGLKPRCTIYKDVLHLLDTTLPGWRKSKWERLN